MAAPASLDIPIIDFTDVTHILDLLPPLDVFYKDILPYATQLRNGWVMRSNRQPLPSVNGVAKHTPDTWVLTTHTVPSAHALLAGLSTDQRYMQPRLDQLLDKNIPEVTSLGRIIPFNTDMVTHISIHTGALLGTYVINLLTIPRHHLELVKLRELILSHVSDLM